MQEELNINKANADAALNGLEVTSFSQADNKNSAWSKPWIIQGTGKPLIFILNNCIFSINFQ
ncbi:hypothetical protein GCM10027291_17600 [Telluribacter humicola]